MKICGNQTFVTICGKKITTNNTCTEPSDASSLSRCRSEHQANNKQQTTNNTCPERSRGEQQTTNKKPMLKIKIIIFNILFNSTSKLLFKNSFIGVITGKLIQIFSKSKYRIIKINRFDNHHSRVNVIEEQEGCVYTPATLEQESKKITKPDCSLGYNHLVNAHVSASSPIIVEGNYAYRQNFYIDFNVNRICYKGGYLIEYGRGHGLFDFSRPKETLDKGIFLGGSWAYTWYHWLIEILPKVELYDFLPKEYKEYPLLIPQKAGKSKNHMDLVKILFKDKEVILIDSEKNYQVKELIWLDSPAINPPKLKGYIKNKGYLSYNMNFDLLRKYRERIFKGVESYIEENTGKFPKRIFLARQQNKRKYNQDEIIEMLKNYKFEPYYCEKLSIFDQILLFKEAESIMGPVGSAWANILFSNENSVGLAFKPEISKNICMGSNISEISKFNMLNYFTASRTNNWADLMNIEESGNIDSNVLEQETIKLLNI